MSDERNQIFVAGTNKCIGSHRLFGKTFGDRCEEDTRIEDSVTVKGLDQVDRVSEDKRGNEEGADDRGEILRDGFHVRNHLHR